MNIKEIIASVVSGYDVSDTYCFEGYVEQCVNRIDWETWDFDQDIQDEGWEAVDTEMIYTDDQWDLMRAWNDNPHQASLEDALSDLCMAVQDVADQIHEELRQEKADEGRDKIKEIKERIIQMHNEIMQMQDELSDYEQWLPNQEDSEDFYELSHDLEDLEATLSDYDERYWFNEENTNPDIEVNDEDFEDLDLITDEDDSK